jgi:thiamine-phosphate diphosphorylase/hydroxyethylthiazole kinase
LLPKGAILGVSVSNIEEAKEIRDKGGVDYVGVGAVWETGSKDVSKKKKLGPMGVGEVLDIIAEAKTSEGGKVESVAIGELTSARVCRNEAKYTPYM